MQTPGIPRDEIGRLAELKSLKILDTEPEERFDRLTRIANRLFGVPIVLVSLVDEARQWFKSSIGLTVRETARDISFCGHTILGDEILVVNDTAKDKRFADNPLVVDGPLIKFYAGCPLTTLNGYKLGTLCLIDSKPREFTAQDKIVLQDLSAMVEREIELSNLATNDDLTGIPNRRGFQVFAEKCLKLCKRKNLPACVVYFDVDRFKYINDEYGHSEGDRALEIIAHNMKSVSRDSDIVARLGGDEFAMMFTGTAKDAAEIVINRFEERLERCCKEEGLGFEVKLSHGTVEYVPAVHTTVGNMLNEGDRLMYNQKHKRSC